MGTLTIEDVVDEILARPVTKSPPGPPSPRPTKRRHAGRAAAKAKRFVCTKAPPVCPRCGNAMTYDTPGCHGREVAFPPGVPLVGCGRIFTTAHGLNVLHPKMFDDPVRWPWGCLSDILAADEREVK